MCRAPQATSTWAVLCVYGERLMSALFSRPKPPKVDIPPAEPEKAVEPPPAPIPPLPPPSPAAPAVAEAGADVRRRERTRGRRQTILSNPLGAGGATTQPKTLVGQ